MLGPGYPLRHGAAHGVVAREAHDLVEVDLAPLAILAAAAGNGRVDGHALALPGSALDHARALVPQHERAGDPVATDPALRHPVQVGAADAHGRHSHQDLPGARDRDRLLVDAHVVRTV